ncbi:hypothetical protein HYH02_004607 [Chlamydomonas schloesseri]|uniref:Pherophorin domain-containing protein n=1 Tax=Chlamydomonas schloesseri TaxID=2026947 RepID=A0A836B8R0_9CHLO|nr:hypothetical protein HYH02_004607 [Chlamydomonas schloesseri]|eukprot:KAG2450770.1 hypothetical protein HYH02_004607 [Chlamydomonas schloesseri]
MMRFSEQTLANGNYQVCFNFDDVGCQSGNACCNSILKIMDKIEIQAEKTCSKAIAAVTFAGGSKIGSTHFDTEFSVGKVRITGLNANRATMQTAQLCLTIKPPCNSFDVFFDSDKLGQPGMYQYAVFNSGHDCCPVCVWQPSSPPPPKNESICDCISVFEPNTRWRLRYRESELKGDFNFFSFNIFTVPSDYCLEVNYRPGYCCDQTLEEVEVAIAPEFQDMWWKLAPRYWFFNTDGSVFQSGAISTQHKSDLGLIFKGFNFNTSSVPPGTELVLTLALNATLWNNTEAFPCGQSHLVDEGGICDYLMYGNQIHDGQPVISPYGDFVPSCCPEGVYLIENPTPFCGCTDNKLESPYRLVMEPQPVTVRGATTYSFRIDTTNAVPPEANAEVDCNKMDLDAVRLYVLPEIANAAAITSVVFNNKTIPKKNITFGNDTYQYWIEIKELAKAKPAIGTSWSLAITVAGAAPPSICAPNALGTGECEYNFFGKFSLRDLEYQCCAHGLSEPTVVSEDPKQCSCNANILASPYRLDYASASYAARPADATTLNFTLTYDQLDCEPNSACCASDLKSVFIEMDTTAFVSAAVSPAVPGGVTVAKLATGIQLTGLFGSANGYDVAVKVSGNKTLANVCGSLSAKDGCKYRLEGGYNVNQPYGCCPTDVTGV